MADFQNPDGAAFNDVSSDALLAFTKWAEANAPLVSSCEHTHQDGPRQLDRTLEARYTVAKDGATTTLSGVSSIYGVVNMLAGLREKVINRQQEMEVAKRRHETRRAEVAESLRSTPEFQALMAQLQIDEGAAEPKAD